MISIRQGEKEILLTTLGLSFLPEAVNLCVLFPRLVFLSFGSIVLTSHSFAVSGAFALTED